MKHLGRLTALLLPAALALSACERREAELIAALPDRETMILKVEDDGQSGRGLSIGQAQQNLVGAPAEWYTNTYYAARDLNVLAGFVVTLLEEITKWPSTSFDQTSAVWGPFSDKNDPNEFKLEIKKLEDASLHYEWSIQGKHKSQGDDAYLALAAGAFEPGKEDQGRGWFVIDFDHIATLDPTQNGGGRIAYALQKNDEGTLVLAHFKGPDKNGDTVEASYAYGENNDAGFIVFRLPVDIDEGQEGKTATEDVLIRTRFTTDGGRADIFAVHGDLGDKIVIGSQCWDKTFVSTFEQFKLGADVLAADGDASTCNFAEAETPDPQALPDADEVESPYTLEQLMR